ncbi:homeobox protein VENTX-like [Oxyura jamaicensis]|uniref:homeobox protein VENTX-like n=1 Tax=Oxyura jamaicensis TaxID=8884 RepID=UPI0015A7110C|nr:homeobox protein VENTX-like [Oxyura jamaicensis]
MRLPAATWPAGDSALNLAPGQAALSSANGHTARLGGCNNHLKGEIKAPLRGLLCSRLHLMLRGLFKPRSGRCFKYLPPRVEPPAPTGCERAVAEMPMDKGRFSVEWLAQSSCGGARTAHRHLRDAQDSRPTDLGAGGPERSGPEAEGGGGGGAAVPGRPRTKFSAAQLQELERSFREQRYIGASEKRRLAALLNLSQSQIKTWFQNRRMKFKRETQDARVEALVSGLFLPYRCYPDVVTPSPSHGIDSSVSAARGVSLHPAVPSPALLVPTVPAPSAQPVLPSPALFLPPSSGLSSYSTTMPAMTLTNDHKRLRFQPYLPSF